MYYVLLYETFDPTYLEPITPSSAVWTAGCRSILRFASKAFVGEGLALTSLVFNIVSYIRSYISSLGYSEAFSKS